ncbi:mitogen-activated protein kinase kinase kinase NPK1 [Magnolia sinica]|uniref:mitogen-activated protein kinase kinase kinase NPK1 n=1 Tax=Magnolia sinica TaxID=86752 RepID=UPI002659BBE0|nr:mitogen-activated protein kinase kinase kinase NPK1 [Magnolia sinica]
MQDIFGSVRRSLVFRISGSDADEGRGGGGLVDKIGSRLRKSGVGFLSKHLAPPPLPSPSPPPSHSPLKKDCGPPIRWLKGELIGCGAYGRVYMGMNQDSGELLAIKQVSIAANNASKEKAQAHIRELEEEVKLLRNLSHPNIVRYLGTAREEESLNILLEFVPGGSISSLLGKFGSFPEAVIRNYTKQLLLGLEYLHRNGIMHRDIKGANILVDNKGCIKVADFGASKKVVELATVSGAKSMKGTPYWMAPEVILQTGHSFSADIWSVGCTVIEMATGKPPWSQQYQQEVAALFHIASTKSHPPIPENLSMEAKDFLLKCLQKEPNLRLAASDLLQHPFVTMEFRDQYPILRSSTMEHSRSSFSKPGLYPNNSLSPMTVSRTTCKGLKDSHNVDSVRCSNLWTSDDMCQIGDEDEFEVARSVRPNDASLVDQFNKSFNPMSEPLDDWSCKFDESPEQRVNFEDFGGSVKGAADNSGASGKGMNDFTFPCGPASEDDDEVTECKIKAFLDEKALELKKLQSPLYEEFYNTMNAASPNVAGKTYSDDAKSIPKLPPKSPSRVASGASSRLVDAAKTTSPSSGSRRFSSSSGGVTNQVLQEIPLPQLNEWKELQLDDRKEPNSPSLSFSERQRKWKEELDQELEREREMKRQAGVVGKLFSPKDRVSNRKRDRLWLASPGK